MFEGLAPIIWKFLAAGGGVAAFGAVAWVASGVRAKLIAACCALTIATTTIAYSVGLSDGENRADKKWQAKWDAANLGAIARGIDARSDAGRAVDRGVRDPRDTDER